MEKTKQTNVVIEKTTNSDDTMENTSKKIQTENLIKELEKEFESIQQELETKKYLIDGGNDMAIKFRHFMANDSKWKFTEALGVVEVIKFLDTFIKDTKHKDLMIGPLELEALYYFMSKTESVGLDAAQNFYILIKAINPAKSRRDADMRKYEEIKFRIDSLKHGVDPAEVENILKNPEN